MSYKKGLNKYTTSLGIVDSSLSRLLPVNEDIMDYAYLNIKLQKKPTKEDTATGYFQTKCWLSLNKIAYLSSGRNVTL